MNTSHQVPAANISFLLSRIADLNRKADRCGCERAIVEITDGDKDGMKCVTLIAGETPKFAGWTLAAAIEMQPSGENIVSCVPGFSVPDSYRVVTNKCDHCRHTRPRKQTFVVVHESGEYKQVGRNCLGDYLGSMSPESVILWAEYLEDIHQEAKDACNEGGYSSETTFNLKAYVEMTCVCIRQLGWVSRTTANAQEIQSTSGLVCWLLDKYRNAQDARDKADFIAKHDLHVEERDIHLGELALTWGKALPTDGDQYLYNLGVAVRLGFVRSRTSGLVASLIVAYQRHMGELADRNKICTSVHVGEVGVRQGFEKVTVKGTHTFDSAFGERTLVTFHDQAGNILKWWASGVPSWLVVNGQHDITGTVKAHEEYKGRAETLLQRVSEGVKVKRKKKAA